MASKPGACLSKIFHMTRSTGGIGEAIFRNPGFEDLGLEDPKFWNMWQRIEKETGMPVNSRQYSVCEPRKCGQPERAPGHPTWPRQSGRNPFGHQIFRHQVPWPPGFSVTECFGHQYCLPSVRSLFLNFRLLSYYATCRALRVISQPLRSGSNLS